MAYIGELCRYCLNEGSYVDLSSVSDKPETILCQFCPFGRELFRRINNEASMSNIAKNEDLTLDELRFAMELVKLMKQTSAVCISYEPHPMMSSHIACQKKDKFTCRMIGGRSEKPVDEYLDTKEATKFLKNWQDDIDFMDKALDDDKQKGIELGLIAKDDIGDTFHRTIFFSGE